MYAHYSTHQAFAAYCMSRQLAVTTGFYDSARYQIRRLWGKRHSKRGPLGRKEIRDALARMKWIR